MQNQKFRLNESWICLGLYCISSSDDSKMSQKFQMTLYFHWWQKWRCWHGSKVEVFFSTLLWFSVPEPWVRTVKYLSFVNQMIQHLFRRINTPWLSLNPCAFFHNHVLFFFSFFYYVLKRSTLQLYCLDWVSCVCLSLSVISVSATEVDGYSKTVGAWILSLNRNLYSVNNVAECAARCDGETAFTCRCSPLFSLTFCIHTG